MATARKAPAKKTAPAPAKKAAAKRPVKKAASASKEPVIRAEELNKDDVANAQAIAAKGPIGGKPKIHAKSVSLIVSIGTKDRNRTIEKFIEDFTKKVGAVPYGQDGIHVSRTSAYYILDGKVCMPDDYDPKTQNFKPGTHPPTWAGGVESKTVQGSSNQEQMHRDAKELSSDEFAKKYKIGKYRHSGDTSRIITPEMQRAMREDARKEKLAKEEAALEEFDWDMEDVDDTEVLAKVADESASEFASKLKKKRVIKKPAKKTAAKAVAKPVRKVVRRPKK